MKKRSVGIYAHYTASEQTWTAMYLAKYIGAQYRHVKWINADPETQTKGVNGFSFYWDDHRQTVGECNPTRDRYASCVFFAPNLKLFKKLKPETTTLFVPNLYDFDRDAHIFARKCTYCLVTCEQWMHQLTQQYGLSNHVLWRFYPVMQYGSPSKVRDEKLRVFFPAYGLNETVVTFIRNVADVVKQLRPNVSTVVGTYNSKLEPTAGYDTRVFDWRFCDYVGKTDVIVDLNPQPAYAFFPTCATGHGLQWIAYDTPTNQDPLTAAHRHTITLPSPQYTAADLEKVSLELVKHLTDIANGHTINNGNAWDIRCQQFIDTTNDLLQLRTG
jgi:hypothetical protein